MFHWLRMFPAAGAPVRGVGSRPASWRFHPLCGCTRAGGIAAFQRLESRASKGSTRNDGRQRCGFAAALTDVREVHALHRSGPVRFPAGYRFPGIVFRVNFRIFFDFFWIFGPGIAFF